MADLAMVVSSAFKGKGLGALLLQQLVDYARARGIATLRFETLPENKPMQKLGHKAGFVMLRGQRPRNTQHAVAAGRVRGGVVPGQRRSRYAAAIGQLTVALRLLELQGKRLISSERGVRLPMLRIRLAKGRCDGRSPEFRWSTLWPIVHAAGQPRQTC